MTSLPAQDMASLTITVKVPCLVCKKVLSFTNVLRHMITVHNEKIGRRWICKEDGKVFQSEQRLVQHDKKHRPEICETEIFQCPDCEYRTLCKDYLGDHRRLMHVQTSHGQYIYALLGNVQQSQSVSQTKHDLKSTSPATQMQNVQIVARCLVPNAT